MVNDLIFAEKLIELAILIKDLADEVNLLDDLNFFSLLPHELWSRCEPLVADDISRVSFTS